MSPVLHDVRQPVHVIQQLGQHIVHGGIGTQRCVLAGEGVLTDEAEIE